MGAWEAGPGCIWAGPEFVGAGGPNSGRELGRAKPILGRAGAGGWKEPGTRGLCG